MYDLLYQCVYFVFMSVMEETSISGPIYHYNSSHVKAKQKVEKNKMARRANIVLAALGIVHERRKIRRSFKYLKFSLLTDGAGEFWQNYDK